MAIPKEVLPFLQAAKKTVDAAEDVAMSRKAGQFLASVIYNLPDPTVLVPYCLEYLEGKNKIKWHAMIPVAATIFAAADVLILQKAAEDATRSYAASLLATRHHAFNTEYSSLFSRIIELRTVFHECERHLQADAATFVPLLNFAIGAAIRAFGPRSCLQLAPLEILNFNMDEPRWGAHARAWWLPLLRQHARRCDSLFFVTELLPIIVEIRRRSNIPDCSAVQKKKYEILSQQIWAVLPSLMGTAVDLDIAFSQSALPKVLIAGLEEPSAQEFVLRALRLSAVHTASIAQAVKLQKELESQANEWGMSLDETKAKMDASAAAGALEGSDDESDDEERSDSEEEDIHNSESRDLKDIFKSLAAEAGMTLGNDLPKEEECAAICVKYTAESTIAAMAKTGGLIPQLFKVVHNIYESNQGATLLDEAARHAQLTFEAIKHLTSLLPQEVTDQNLDMLATRLLKLVLAQTGESSADEKTFPLEMTCLADLIDALIVRASDAKLSICLKVFAPIIRIDPDETVAARTSSDFKMAARALQRRAYRILRHALDRMAARTTETPTTDALAEIWTQLSDARPYCQASALASRMQCLGTFLVLAERSMVFYGVQVFQQFRNTVIQEVTKEVVTRAREVSKEVRRFALIVLRQLCNLCLDCIEQLTQVVAIGLAGDALLVRPSTLICLARILSEFGPHMSENFIINLCNTGLITLKAREKPVVREAIRFALVVVKVCPAEHIKSIFPAFLELLHNPNSPQVRLRVRRLIDRLIKKLGSEFVRDAMPESHKPLITYVLRAQRRKARKAAKGAKRAVIEGEIESDEESSDANTEIRGQHFGLGTVTGDSKLSGMSSLDEDENMDSKSVKFARFANNNKASSVRRHLRDDEKEISDAELIDSDDEERRELLQSRAFALGGKRRSDGTWLVERDGEAMDLAGMDSAANVLSKRTKRTARTEGGADSDEDNVVIGENGKIRINSQKKDDRVETRLEQLARQRLQQLRTERSNAKDGEKKIGADGEVKKSEKEKKHESVMAKRRIGHFAVHTAAQWASNRAGGDVVKAGSAMAPVAFTQLNPMLMKEKYIPQSTKSLESLFNTGGKKQKGKGLKGEKKRHH